jgi:hypothetical protein
MSEHRRPGCPAPADLLHAHDDTLPPEKSRRTRAHLARCEHCRADLAAVAAVAVDRDPALAHSDQAAEASTARAQRFRQRVDAYENVPLLIHLKRLPHLLAGRIRNVTLPEAVHQPTFRWMSIATVGAAVMAGLMILNSSIAVLRAEALLKNIVSHAPPAGLMQQVEFKVTPNANAPAMWKPHRGAARPQPPLVTVRPYTIVRDTIDGRAVPIGDSAAADSSGIPLPADVRRLIELQPVNTIRPLDVALYQTWRHALTEKHDEVTALEGGLLQLRTTTMQGPLHEVSLIVEPETYRVVKQMFVFDGTLVEIAVLKPPTPDMLTAQSGQRQVGTWSPGAINTTGVTAEAELAAREAAAREALDRSELEARLMLREAGLDLSGDFKVSRQKEAVTVDGAVLTAAQRTDLKARLSTLPRVTVNLRVREAGAMRTAAAASRSRMAGGARPALSRWLTHTFAEGSTAGARFVPELTQLVSVVAQRFTALQDLAERYQPADVRALTPQSRDLLQHLVNLHYDALNTDLLGLDKRIAVLFGSRDRCAETSQAPADWSRRAVAGLRHVRTLDQQVQELLSHDDLPTMDASGISAAESHLQIDRTFSALWDAVNLTPTNRNLVARGPSGT